MGPLEYRAFPVLRVQKVKKALLVLTARWVNEGWLDLAVQLVLPALED